MPRLSKYEFNERYEQIKLWSEELSTNTRILGGTKGGVFEIICNHERTSLNDKENGVSKFIATEALKQLSVSKINNLILEIAKHSTKNQIISDVGSVKDIFNAEILKLNNKKFSLVPGHPIAGTEYSGAANSKKNLFQNKWCNLPC